MGMLLDVPSMTHPDSPLGARMKRTFRSDDGGIEDPNAKDHVQIG